MSKNSLDNIDAKLSEMLTNSTRVFDISMNALLGDTNLDSVRDDLYDTDKAINELHREVRREMIIHSAVNSRNFGYTFTTFIHDYVKRYRAYWRLL